MTLNRPLPTVPNRRVKDEINAFKNTRVTPTRTPEAPMFRSLVLDAAS